MIKAGDAVFFDVTRGFLTLHVFLDLKRILHVVENSVSAVNDKLSMPWAESFVTHNHAHDVAVLGLSAY